MPKQSKVVYTDAAIRKARAGGHDEHDGRKRVDPDEADENGKWHKLRSRPSVVVSRDNVREVKA
jgi:hypothetical protein